MISNEQQRTAQDHDEIALIDLWHAAWRYKYLFALIIGVFAVVAAYIALTATPIFRAETTVSEVDGSGKGPLGSLAGQLGGLAGLVGVNLGGDRSVRQAQAVLASRRLVEEFITRNNLLPELYPGANPPTLWKAVRAFRAGNLKIHSDESSGLTTVSIDWRDPVVAARWTNEYVALANELLRTRAIEDSTRNIAYLNSQIAKTNIVEVQKVMYSLIESETKTQMVANGKAEYAFTVVDPAVAPEIRISPRRTLMVLVGMLLGGIVATGIAVTHNMVSKSRRST